MKKEKYLSYCGLYCDLCGARCRTPNKAKELADTLRHGEFEEWGPSFPEFNDFWKLLNQLADVPEEKCCKTMKCGHPDCSIRKCAMQKELETCAFCNEYPCEKITRFAKSEPLLIQDGYRIKEIGIKAWISEQEKRKETGFAYDDVRCGKPDIPLG